MPHIEVITPAQLDARIRQGAAPMILDVREPFETELAPFPGAHTLPMGDVPARLGELDPDREIVVVCHHGVRSAQVAAYLSDKGFARVLNLAGGIEAWSLEVDPSVPRY